MGVFELIVKVVAALRGADEEGAALAIGKGRTENLGPGEGMHGGIFVEDDEIEAVAAERGGVESAADGDAGAGMEVDAEFGFVGTFGPKGAGEGFEALPDDAFGLAVVGADVPDGAFGLDGEAHDFGEGEVGFAEAAAGDENAEAGGGVEDEELVGFEREEERLG